jgi:hypothetical protein
MRPAVLAYLVRGIDVESLTGTQPFYQLASKLDITALCVAGGLHLAQSLVGSANDELVKAYALATATKCV